MAEIKQIKIEATGLKNIKKELDDIKKSMKDVTDPSEMAKLTAEADKLESTLEGVNDKVKEFGEESTDSLNGAGKSFEDLKTAITELDFEKVQSQVDSFAKASANVTFSGAIKSLKTLGKTFITLGKALLTNPLFLLAAVITAIVIAVYKFLDSLGIIQMALDALMKPIQYIIDLFYSLTDAMGLTNEAAQKAANETAKAYADSAKEISKANESITQDLDYQIKLAQLNGESTIELEREKLRVIRETLTAQMKAEEAALEAKRVSLAKKKTLTDEEIADLEKLEDAYRKTSLAVKEAGNNQTLFEVKTYNEREAARQKELEAIEKSNMEKAAKAKAYREKQEAIRKEEAANRLAAQRLEKDLEIELMEEGDAKLLEQNRVTYERLIEDTKANEKLNAEEKARVIKQYEDIAAQKAIEIKTKTSEAEAAVAKQAQEELSAILYDLQTDDQQKVLDSLDEYYEENINKLREHLEEGLITKEEFAEAEVLLEQEKADKILAIETANEEAIRAEREATLQSNIDTAATYASAVNDLAGSIFEISNNLGEQDEEAKEKRARKQFAVQKALNLVMAGIDGARAITTSLASAPLAIGPAPNPAGIASLAAVAVNTAATMAAIASKQFTGSGGGGGSVPTPKTDIGSSTPSRVAPIANFQGTGSNRNEVSAGGSNSNITIENNVSVSETEITDKQKTIHNLTQQSQL